MTTAPQIDETKLNQVLGRAVDDLGGVVSASLVLIGEQLGLYRALEKGGAMTAQELAAATATDLRYLRTWLTNQASSGFIDYDPDTERFSLSPEQAMVFTDPKSPVGMVASYDVFLAATKATDRIAGSFRTGEGMSWGEHEEGVQRGTAIAFGASYLANLVQNWIPALDGVQEKLERGARVADVGCGYGISTIIMAKEYPNSQFVGIDAHAPSIEQARADAIAAGVADRVTFQVGRAQDFEGESFDLIAFFDAVHDMGDPLGALRQARSLLKPDGTVLAVEPMAGDKVEENFNPIGRMYSGVSVLVCSAHAISEGSERPLSTVATEPDLAAVFREAGFSKFRRVAESALNRVFEARI